MSEGNLEQRADQSATSTKPSVSLRSGILKWFSRPWVGILGAIASLVGLVATVFFYFAAQQTRELVFYPHPVKTTVAKAGASSQLRVIYRDRDIGTDVTAAQVAVWNNGRASIRPENVLRPVTIVTQPPVPILEATIRKTSRDVIGLKLDDCGFSRGFVCVSWRILEHADGGVIQLTYAGSQQVELAMKGIIEGQSAILNVRYPGEIKDPTSQVATVLLPRWFGWVGSLVFLLTTCSVSLLLFKLTAKFRERNPWGGFLALEGVSLLSLGVVFVTLMLFSTLVALPSPPFSF